MKMTMATELVKQALQGAESRGLDINNLLQKIGISPSSLDDPNARIAVEKFVLLSRYTNGEMKDEMNGLLAKPMRLGSFRAMALSAVHCQTIGRALERSIEFYNLFENTLEYQLTDKGNQVEYRVMRRPGQQILNSMAIETALTVQHRFIGWLANERIILNQIKLDYPAPSYSAQFKYFFYGAPVLFEQKRNSIYFDKTYLQRPIMQNEASVERYVRRAPMDIYLQLDAGGKVTREVRNHINDFFGIHNKAPELEILAQKLELHPQTLRRRLKREGSQFHDIKSQVRRDIAIHHLGKDELSIEEIAYKAGYTESGAFIRAFKAWTGFTPLNFRKGL